MDPFSLISGGAGGVSLNPASGASSSGEATQAAAFNVTSGGSTSTPLNKYALIGGAVVLGLLLIKRGR